MGLLGRFFLIWCLGSWSFFGVCSFGVECFGEAGGFLVFGLWDGFGLGFWVFLMFGVFWFGDFGLGFCGVWVCFWEGVLDFFFPPMDERYMVFNVHICRKENFAYLSWCHM